VPEKLYTGQEAAALLGVTYETVLKLAQEGVLRSVRIGRLRRFPESGLDEFVSRNTDVVVDLTSRLHPPDGGRS
jgi:excisionase family DNA binding protein